ncbi:MAG: Uma2 family endonuclease [Bryobacteraceae bacterium]
MPVSTAALTPDGLLRLPRPKDGEHYELSDGELITVGNAGALHELIKTRLFEILTEYRLQNKSGRAFAETQFTLRSDRARIPDVAWVSQAKLDLIPRENRAIPIAPDVAIEVISDSEQPEEMEQKLRDYLEADVEAWQVFPSVQSITRWHGNEGTRLGGDQLLTSERLPGLSMPVSDVFSV